MTFFTRNVKTGFLTSLMLSGTLSSVGAAPSAPVGQSLVITAPPPIVQEIKVEPEKEDPKLVLPVKVVTSFSVLQDLVKVVGKDRVKVTSLVANEQDTHAYTAKPKDMKMVAGANLLVLNGRGLEGWMEKLVSSDGVKAKKLVILENDSKASDEEESHEDHDHEEGQQHNHDDHEQEEEHQHDHSLGDPHQWHNPEQLKKVYIQKIVTSLSEIDPEGKAIYQKNADQWTAELDKTYGSLNQYIQTLKQKYDEKHPDDKGNACHFIVMHEAFNSLGKAYNCTFKAVGSMNSLADPSPKTMASVIRLSRQNKDRPLFSEPIFSEKVLAQIQKETGVQIYPLYSDYLSMPDGKASTVLDMVKYNGEQLVKAMEQVTSR